MNWTQVDIYTSTAGIDLLCSNLMDLGIRGFSIQDAEDFNEFLQNKDGKWDYIDEDLMGLSHCESCDHLFARGYTGSGDAADGAEFITEYESSGSGTAIRTAGSRFDGCQGRGLGE